MDKNILIQTGENLLYIQLDENSSVEKIYLLNTNEKEFGISKIFCSKYNQYFILLSTLEKGIPYYMELLHPPWPKSKGVQ